MNLKKYISIVAVLVVSGLIIYGFILMSQIFADNTKFSDDEVYVHVPTNATYTDVKKEIKITNGAKDVDETGKVWEKVKSLTKPYKNNLIYSKKIF